MTLPGLEQWGPIMFRFLLIFLIISCGSVKTKKPVKPIEYGQYDYLYFVNISGKSYVKRAVNIANCVNNNEDFIKAVSLVESFDYSDHNGAQVAKALKSENQVKVDDYKTWDPWSSVNAKFHYGIISFNNWNNPRQDKSMVNTLIHERLHFLKYGHGDNYNQDKKKNSVNHKVGKLSEKYVENCVY